MTETQRMDAIYDLSTIWKYAGEIFPYFEEVKIDWDGAYYTYLERMYCAETVKECHMLMAEFLNLLGDGHTDYRFPEKLVKETGFLPFTLTYLGGEWFIREVLPGMEKFLSAKVLSVNGMGMEEFFRNCFRYIYHVGNYAGWWKLKEIMPFLLKKCGNEMLTSKGMMRFNLVEDASAEMIPIRREIPSEKPKIQVYQENGKKVLYVRIDNFVYPTAGEEIMAALSHCRGGGEGNAAKDSDARSWFAGVILDVRNNIGGMTAYAARVAELFISGEFSACQKKTRRMKGLDLSSASQYAGMEDKQIERCIQDGLCTRQEVERCLRTAKNMNYYEYQDSFGAPGHKAVFDGPVILLTGRGTVSAAEDFTAMFQSTGRAILMGEATFGSTGTPFLKRLRTGGLIRICSVGYRLLDGTEFIGKGISPDVFVRGSIEEYVEGRDTVLGQALERLVGIVLPTQNCSGGNLD